MHPKNNILEWDEEQIKQFMKSIWIVFSLGFPYRINAIPDLRKQFPDFTWEFVRDPSDAEIAEGITVQYGDRLKTSNMIWELEGGILFAALKDKNLPFGSFSCNLSEMHFPFTSSGIVDFFPGTNSERTLGDIEEMLLGIKFSR